MMPIGGALFGEKDYTGIRYLLKVAASITVTICTVIAALLFIFPYLFAQIFNVDVESINLYLCRCKKLLYYGNAFVVNNCRLIVSDK